MMTLEQMREYWGDKGFTLYSERFDLGAQFGFMIEGNGVSHAIRFKLHSDDPTEKDLMDAQNRLIDWLEGRLLAEKA